MSLMSTYVWLRTIYHVGTINLVDYYVDPEENVDEPNMLVLRCLRKLPMRNRSRSMYNNVHNEHVKSPGPKLEEGMWCFI